MYIYKYVKYVCIYLISELLLYIEFCVTCPNLMSKFLQLTLHTTGIKILKLVCALLYLRRIFDETTTLKMQPAVEPCPFPAGASPVITRLPPLRAGDAVAPTRDVIRRLGRHFTRKFALAQDPFEIKGQRKRWKG